MKVMVSRTTSPLASAMVFACAAAKGARARRPERASFFKRMIYVLYNIVLKNLKMKTALMILCLVLSGAAFSRAETLPNLRDQAAWGEKEKKEFLGFLKSNQAIPAGQVKQIAAGNGNGGRRAPSKARYASLAMGSDTPILDI